MSQTFYEFSCPVKIVCGHAALEHIPFELGSRASARPLIVTDPGVRAAGLLDVLQASLRAGGVAADQVFDEVPVDSSLAAVRKTAAVYRESGCDALIAVGGGSVIDTVKAANILVSEGGDDLRRFAGAHRLTRRLRPLFVVPTTAGTGSEVTLVAVISDTEAGVKQAFASAFLMPDLAVLDPRMTVTLPAHITAMTAMDALTHAVEAYTGLAANPISDAYATAAVEKIARHLLPTLDRPGDAQLRLELAQASTMAGIAFSSSMVGMVHALGHSVGALCHLPHGLCMGVLLPHVLEYNLAARAERIGELLLPVAGAEIYAATPRAERAQATIAAIRRLCDAVHTRCGLPRTLAETGRVGREQLEAIADLAQDDGAILFNPAEARREELRAVLERAYG